MKFFFLLLGIFSSAVLSADELPKRIVSLGLCTDQLLLQMVERERIASLTYKSTDKKMSYMAEHVGDIPLNRGSVEEILPYQPDLIVSSAYAGRDTARLLKQLGYPVKTIPLPRNVEDIYSMLRLAGEWFGAEQKAEQMIRKMEQSIRGIQQHNKEKPIKTAIIYSPNGYTIGGNTLENDVMRLAGFRNLSAEMGVQQFQKISLEQLIATRPDVILIDNHVYNRDSLAHQYISHPVLMKILPKEQHFFIPSRLRACGGIMTTEAISYLADKR